MRWRRRRPTPRTDGACRCRRHADHRDGRGDRAHRCRVEPRAARCRGRLDAAAADRRAVHRNRRAGAIRSSKPRCATAGERFVANDLVDGRQRPAVADHRPEHGRQVDVPAPDGADRRPRPGGQLRSRVTRDDRHRRPPVQPRRSIGQSRSRTFDLHGRDGRDCRDPRAGDPESLVILDEIGRGTSTYDGLAIAWAVVEAMHDEVKCRTLFATHYHELTRLAGRLDSLSLHHVRAREWKGELVLLHEVADGAADRSYGIAVAKLAGLPPASRCPGRVRSLPSSKPAEMRPAALLRASTICPCLPLAAEPEHGPDPLTSALEAIDPDRLSPREALDKLYELKRLFSRRTHIIAGYSLEHRSQRDLFFLADLRPPDFKQQHRADRDRRRSTPHARCCRRRSSLCPRRRRAFRRRRAAGNSAARRAERGRSAAC